MPVTYRSHRVRARGWTGVGLLEGIARNGGGVPPRQEVLAFTEQSREGWTDVTAEPLEVLETPASRVLVLTRQSARGRQSGVRIVIHFFELWTLRGGKLRMVEYFRHRGDAFAAAGLRAEG